MQLKTWWLRMLKTFSKEEIRCRSCFFEELKEIGVEKMHEILTEIDKNTKNSNSENLMQFCVILESLGGLEFQRRFKKEQIGCQEDFFEEINEVF